MTLFSLSASARKSLRLSLAVAAASFLLTAAGVAAQAQEMAQPAFSTGGFAGANAAAAATHRWPMRIQTANGLITIYQPQATSLDGDKLVGRAAVSILRPGQTEPVFGAMWMESRIFTDRSARTVQILETKVTRARFPDSGASEQELTDALRAGVSQQPPMVLSLDQLLTTLQLTEQERAAGKELAAAPPAILFRDHPAVLVQYDGEPRLSQAPNSNLFRVINTPFFVALEPGDKSYYLKGGGRWYVAPDPTGPFKAAAQVPVDMIKLATDSGYADPQQPLTETQAAGLEIVTATQPTELIWTDGAEEMGTIPGTDLLYVTNTGSDVFLKIDTQQIFVLLSGRWYEAQTRGGPWVAVAPDQLPPDFQRIPPGSAKGSVLAQVAGTPQAKEALADTFVPQTVAIDRNNFQQPTVAYDGPPNFEPIENTQMSYAVNTPSSVVQVGGQYYCCADAVWYAGAQPVGPWALCTSVPAAIYTIPPTCPIYPVRFAYVYDVRPDAIYVGYLPGYVGCYRNHGVVVYGTGYHYRPWWDEQRHVFYARPLTFGIAARYDAYTNHWGFGFGWGFAGFDGWFADWPLGGARVVYVGDWFGYGGYRPMMRIDDERRLGQRDWRADFNVYERRRDVRQDLTPLHGPAGSGIAARPAVAGRAGEARPELARPNPAAVGGGAAAHNNVFADPNGNVYRKTLDGWEQHQKGGWVQAGPSHAAAPAEAARAGNAPAGHAPEGEPGRGAGSAAHAVPAELNNEYQARVAGAERARSYGAPAAAPSSPSRGGEESRGGGGQPAGQSGNQGGGGPSGGQGGGRR